MSTDLSGPTTHSPDATSSVSALSHIISSFLLTPLHSLPSPHSKVRSLFLFSVRERKDCISAPHTPQLHLYPHLSTRCDNRRSPPV